MKIKGVVLMAVLVSLLVTTLNVQPAQAASYGGGWTYNSHAIPSIIPYVSMKFSRSETFRIYNARVPTGIGIGTTCVVAKAALAGAFCGIMVGYIWYYINYWVEYAAIHYNQCLYMRVPAPPFGTYYFAFVGSVKSVRC